MMSITVNDVTRAGANASAVMASIGALNRMREFVSGRHGNKLDEIWI